MVRVLTLSFVGLVTHELTAVIDCNGIRRLSGFGKLVGPLAQ